MIAALFSKIKEALCSVLPVTALVFLLNLTPLVHFSGYEMAVFAVSAVFLIIGIGLFTLGADVAMTPMGEHIGYGLTKSGSMPLLLSVCFAMGLLITVAEPDLTVLANQVAGVVSGGLLIATVGVGVGLFLLLSIVKIVFHTPLSRLLTFFYLAIFAIVSILVATGKADFLAMGFDSGGVTTGPVTVPFIMALGVGIAGTLGGKNAGENSFGLIALCSVGPILAVLALGLFSNGQPTPPATDGYGMAESIWEAALHHTADVFLDVLTALGMIVAFFLVLQIFVLKLPRVRLYRIGVGILYTFAGLVVFLSAVGVGFMPIGYKLGQELAAVHPAYLVGFAFVLGMVVVLAEPAVHVLNRQVEEITEGTVSRTSMMIALSVGVGISIALSVLRIYFDFSVLYYLVPGYLLSLGLSFFVPGIYTAIAFDSGGVASGPLTSGFILPFGVGACMMLQGSEKLLADGFGIVAMVAMTPLITIQLLGFRAVVTRKVREKIAMRRILAADDEQIISFM